MDNQDEKYLFSVKRFLGDRVARQMRTAMEDAESIALPEDVDGWLNDREHFARQLEMGQFILSRIAWARQLFTAGNEKELKLLILEIDRNCDNAQSDSTHKIGMEFRDRQANNGKRRAAERWGSENRGVVYELIEKLRGPGYEDWKSNEKWDSLLGLMDRELLNPIENWIKGDADKSTIRYDGCGETPLTYKTFKNRLSGK